MQSATKIAVLFFLSVGFANGQDEELLGLPVEFEFFGPDFRNEDLYKEEDIFKDDTYSENSNTFLEDTIRNLCNQYDLILDNQRIDCKNVRLVQKTLNINEHILHKREAGDETQLEEGSGAGEEVPEPAPEPTNEEPAEEHIAEEPAEEPKSDDTASLATEEQKEPQEDKEEAVALPTAEEATVPQPEEEPSANETVPVEAEQTNEEPPAETNTVLEESHSAIPEIEQPQAKEDEAPAATPVVDLAQPIAVDDSEGEQKAKTTAQPATEGAAVKELDAVTPGGIRKKGRVLKPTDLEEANKAKESEDAEADTEKLKENQSGIAVFHSDGKGTLEGTDEALSNMKPNEKLKQAPTDSQEQTGESTKEIQQGRKDTKVLIILFVAVVVVGGAAFAYNFIKKRKQKKAAEATENGGTNATQRSLQNLTSTAKSDPEHGTELKPLMKNPEQKPVVAEYTDEKENRKPEEVK